MNSASQALAAFSAGLSWERIPSEIIERAKVSLLHNVGVGLAGHSLVGAAFATARDLAPAAPDSGFPLPVDGTWVSPEAASQAIATLFHARSQDDTQLAALTHMGATILPGILALGYRDDRHGRDLLSAMVAGYETSSAYASPFSEDVINRGFRPTAVFGPIGAAIACSHLLGLSAAQTTNAIAHAASLASGTNQQLVDGTMEGVYQAGAASRSGLFAATLASQGVLGSTRSLEGEIGHLHGFAGISDSQENLRIGADLGRVWQSRTISYKAYPVCALNQVPVTLAIDFAKKNEINPREIESVVVRLAPYDANYPGVDAYGPFTDLLGAVMSNPFGVAIALTKGNVELADLAHWDDPHLQQLAHRIRVVADPDVSRGDCYMEFVVGGLRSEASFHSEPTTFTWDRRTTRARLDTMAPEMPLPAAQLDHIYDLILDFENVRVRELVNALIRE